MATRVSTPFFQTGRRARLLQYSAELACQNLQDSWKTFCLEGYFFQDALETWRYQPGIAEVWQLPMGVSPVQAISIGMALGYQGRPIPISYLLQLPNRDYVIDGWSFTYSLAHPEGSHSCWNGPWALGNEICHYAHGRAHYFVSGSPPPSTTPSATRAGFAFARTYHLERSQRSGSLGALINSINEPQNISPTLRSCLRKQHYYYCQGEQ